MTLQPFAIVFRGLAIILLLNDRDFLRYLALHLSEIASVVVIIDNRSSEQRRSSDRGGKRCDDNPVHGASPC